MKETNINYRNEKYNNRTKNSLDWLNSSVQTENRISELVERSINFIESNEQKLHA